MDNGRSVTTGRAVALVLATALTGCAVRGPVIGGASVPTVTGTISGMVTSSAGDTPLSARRVVATNVVSGERHETSTAMNGGYTMKVPMGRYRLTVELREGERLLEAPDDTDVSESDLDAQRDFVITVSLAAAASRAP